LAEEPDAEEKQLLLLAERVPETIRKRVIERSEIFMALAELGDADLAAFFKELGTRAKQR
jgi:hypothetical protein